MYRDPATDVVVVDDSAVWPVKSDEPLVILPYYGEFGHFINSFIRQVHYLHASAKIVCCRQGEEVYFPSATNFHYDWRDQFGPDEKVGFRDRWPPTASFSPSDEELALIRRLRLKFAGYQIALLAQPLTAAQVVGMPVPITNPPSNLPRFDVAVCCRRRRWDAYRNFDRWPEILAPLAERGFTIAIVGEADSSYDFDFAHFRSWTHSPRAENAVHILANTRLYIGTDTGPTHLAALVSPALLLFRNEACPYENYITGVVAGVAGSRAVPFRYLPRGWMNPVEVSEAASTFLACGRVD